MTAPEIRAARHALGLSVREFARAVTDPARSADGKPAVSPRNVRYWETGRLDVPEFVQTRVQKMLAGQH